MILRIFHKIPVLKDDVFHFLFMPVSLQLAENIVLVTQKLPFKGCGLLNR